MQRLAAVFLIISIFPALAQEPAGQAVADAATYGAVAALAPLCNLHDEAWAQDLRRAARHVASPQQPLDDASLNAAPGAGQMGAALGYGEMEALEDMAADKLEPTCANLQKNPALTRAEAAVKAFRAARDARPVG